MERMIVQHLHTKDSGKKPSPDSIMDGELAINYVANGETLFIKNSEGAIAEFKDDKYYQKQLSEKTDKTLSLTYSELVSLRDNSQLIPGQQYRITDYQCTTSQENTQSAGHVFDIIVKADSENKLNEEANAIQHTKDDIDYFANSDLSAWKLWYCLDNDTNRFAWADSTNGKGVIYRMIDEWNNDVPYDFKNIQYNGSWGYWAYTFNWQNDASDDSCEDLSVAQYAHTNDEGGYSHTYGNVIKPCELGDANYGYPLKLNACVFLNTESYDGGLYYGCDSNTFGNDCYNNVFGNDCDSNTFGNDCYSNAFGNDCGSNTFGNDCDSNTFGNDCYSNAFGNGCYSNAFGNGCYSNAFGNDCGSNTFGNNCDSNTFGNDCGSNTFGNNCGSNTFGNDCGSIRFASDETSTTKYNYYQYNHFGDGCAFLIFKGTETSSHSQQVQNYNFAQGLQGTLSAYLTIKGERNRAYETYISRGTDRTIKESVIAEKLDKVIEISYNDLVTLRGSSKLVPGQQYRITDYTCTTAQEGTRSAGHQFDIIVTADDESTLNEEARAVKHEGDTYFTSNDLNVWQIWYCLDNDTARFAWADATNGKGVIYRMIDEFGNDVPYDFKNIQFYRKWDSGKSLWSNISSNKTGVPCYTFSSSGNSATTLFTDTSLQASNGVYSNVIGKYVSGNKQNLSNICFFGNDCYSNTFGNDCYDNTFGNFFELNTFGNNCYSNTFRNRCILNTFGNSCDINTFGDFCWYNTFGNICCSSTFGNNCQYNTFGNYCSSNTLGSDCLYNTFGNKCKYNTFGNYCSNNTFGNNCQYIKFTSNSSSTTKYNYYQHNHFGDGCQYIKFAGTETASDSQQVQNYNFAQGLQGTDIAYLTIDGVRNRNFETKVEKNSNGNLKIFCLADLIYSEGDNSEPSYPYSTYFIGDI